MFYLSERMFCFSLFHEIIVSRCSDIGNFVYLCDTIRIEGNWRQTLERKWSTTGKQFVSGGARGLERFILHPFFFLQETDNVFIRMPILVEIT